MKNKPIKKRIVRVQNKGIITLPIIFRRNLQIEENDLVEIEIEHNQLIVRKLGQDRPSSAPEDFYSEDQIDEMLKKDVLHPKIAKKLKKLIAE